jgi:hypothetical protein
VVVEVEVPAPASLNARARELVEQLQKELEKSAK